MLKLDRYQQDYNNAATRAVSSILTRLYRATEDLERQSSQKQVGVDDLMLLASNLQANILEIARKMVLEQNTTIRMDYSMREMK